MKREWVDYQREVSGRRRRLFQIFSPIRPMQGNDLRRLLIEGRLLSEEIMCFPYTLSKLWHTYYPRPVWYPYQLKTRIWPIIIGSKRTPRKLEQRA